MQGEIGEGCDISIMIKRQELWHLCNERDDYWEEEDDEDGEEGEEDEDDEEEDEEGKEDEEDAGWYLNHD